MPGYVYILYSAKLDRYYVGSTDNIIRRLGEHNRKKGKYTDVGIPWAFCDKKNLPCKGDLVYGYFFRSFLRCLLQFDSYLRR
ncbi:MAG: GIY-YIG nuclease family protein [Paludibacteraceae bacterium]|nr:GIY-YIG nuclease family protein [Paludibacteraceae bacterium]